MTTNGRRRLPLFRAVAAATESLSRALPKGRGEAVAMVIYDAMALFA